MSAVVNDEWNLKQLDTLVHDPAHVPGHFVSTIEVREDPQQDPVSAADIDAIIAHETWDDTAWPLVKRVHLYVDMQRVRFEIEPEQGNGDRETKSRTVSIWCDGRQATIWPDQDAVIIDDSPVPLNEQENYYLYIFSRLQRRLNNVLQWRLEKAAEGSVRIEEVSETASAFQFSVRYGISADYPGASWRVRLLSRADPRLLSIEQLVPQRGSGDDRPVLIQRLDVRSWLDTGQGSMPNAARYGVYGRQTKAEYESVGVDFPYEDENTWFRQRSSFRLTDFKTLSPNQVDETRFEIPSLRGTRVADRTLRISYEIGQTYLKFDGTMYELPQPVENVITADSLGDLLEKARPIDNQPESLNEDSHHRDSEPDGNSADGHLLTSVGVGFIACGVLVTLMFIRAKIKG